jgi:hypothetical protein
MHILPQSSMVVVRATKKETDAHGEIPKLFSALSKKVER